MTQLTPHQRELLTLAAAADDVETTPGTKSNCASLIKRGLMISVPRSDGPSRLMITAAGRAAIGFPPLAPSAPAPRPPDEPTPKRGGKIPTLLDLLMRPEGATIAVMMEATGWQAHSVRGAMSGAIGKTLGLTVTSEKTEAGRVYRIVDGAQA